MDIAAFVSAFGAGLLSFFSPCILPLFPVYVGILTTGVNDEQLGLARRCANMVASVLGIVVFASALVLAGFVKVPLLQRDSRKGCAASR